MKRAKGDRFISAASLLESHIVLRRRYSDHSDRTRTLFDKMVSEYALAIEAVEEAHARLAVEAFHRFGKGTGAGVLNFGDCFSYALAKQRDDELLFVGDDFGRTDVKVAKY